MKVQIVFDKGKKFAVFRIHVSERRAVHHLFVLWHYNDVIMTTIASQITSLTVVYSTIYSDADQRKHQSSASLAFLWGIHRDRWIPRTKGQLRGKCSYLMTSSWIYYSNSILVYIILMYIPHKLVDKLYELLNMYCPKLSLVHQG